jgi:hypothetical protein
MGWTSQISGGRDIARLYVHIVLAEGFTKNRPL